MTALTWVLRLACFALPWFYMPTWPAVAMTVLTLAANVGAAAAWSQAVVRGFVR